MSDLKAGSMGSSASPTVPSEFVNSMAAAMENAYHASLAADGLNTFETSNNTEGDRDRRRIFVAIAQGVVGYLASNDDAFRLVGTGVPSGWAIEIRRAP